MNGLRQPKVAAGVMSPAGQVRPSDYDLSMAQLDPRVPLEDHRRAMGVVHGWFRQAGLSTDEARLLVDRFNAAVDPYSRPVEAGDRLAKEADDYLRALWGADYPRNMALVAAAVDRLGGAALEEFLAASGLRFDPFVIRTLADAALRNGWTSPNNEQEMQMPTGAR